MRRHSSMPSMPGITQSSRAKVGASGACRISHASIPFSATTYSKPDSSRHSLTRNRSSFESSTSSIFTVVRLSLPDSGQIHRHPQDIGWKRMVLNFRGRCEGCLAPLALYDWEIGWGIGFWVEQRFSAALKRVG